MVPEEFEASVELCRRILHRVGVPVNLVAREVRIIRERRLRNIPRRSSPTGSRSGSSRSVSGRESGDLHHSHCVLGRAVGPWERLS